MLVNETDVWSGDCDSSDHNDRHLKVSAAMRFSLIYDAQTTDASRAGDRRVFEDMVEQSVLAEEMGFDVIWAVEHTG
ncbi:MAG: flavin-dependent oxidoreductase, partial [Rhodospirillales bacterium]|nr:flavin-dependent oxidoreductase [Rhodospirillales bacterium]